MAEAEELAGRTDDLKELGLSHNTLDRTEPNRAGPDNQAALSLCEGGSALVCSLTQGRLFLEARQLQQGRGGERACKAAAAAAAAARLVTQEATLKFTQTSTGTRCMNAQSKYTHCAATKARV